MSLTLTLVTETEKAALYRTKEGKEIWIPRSVISHRTKRGDLHTITVEEWFVKKTPVLKDYL